MRADTGVLKHMSWSAQAAEHESGDAQTSWTRLLDAVAPAGEAVLGCGVDRLVAKRLDAWRQHSAAGDTCAVARTTAFATSYKLVLKHRQACQAHAPPHPITLALWCAHACAPATDEMLMMHVPPFSAMAGASTRVSRIGDARFRYSSLSAASESPGT